MNKHSDMGLLYSNEYAMQYLIAEAQRWMDYPHEPSTPEQAAEAALVAASAFNGMQDFAAMLERLGGEAAIKQHIIGALT